MEGVGEIEFLILLQVENNCCACCFLGEINSLSVSAMGLGLLD